MVVPRGKGMGMVKGVKYMVTEDLTLGGRHTMTEVDIYYLDIQKYFMKMYSYT